jgi:hypothetical protein
VAIVTLCGRRGRLALVGLSFGLAFTLAACGSSASQPGGQADSVPAAAATTPDALSYTPPKAVFTIAREFVKTAVLRTDLARAWSLTAPKLRESYTEDRWLTGDIPIVPFPKRDFGEARYKVVQATPDDVMLEVLIIPGAGSVLTPVEYYMHLVPGGKTWLVSYWAPRGGSPGGPVLGS